MNAKTATAVAAALVLAIVGAVAWRNYRSSQEALFALDLLAQKQVRLDSGLQRANGQIAAAGRDDADRRAGGAAEPADAPARPKVRITPGANGRAFFAILLANPKISALQMQAFRANMPATFGRLFRALNLNPDQIGKFENLSVQHQEAVFDILATANSQGVAFNDPAIGTLMQQENTQFQAAQQALLGQAGYQQMQQLNRAGPVTGIVNNLAQAVALSETPLSGVQADQLTQILANASTQYQGGGRATPATINWTAALGQAQGVLTPSQYTALQGSYTNAQVNQFKAQFDQQEKAGQP